MVEPKRNPPLAGLRVLDFTTLLPGPYATMLLADMGADVVKVEAPGRPDLTRMREPFDGGESATHHTLHRNKRSIALDLKDPRGGETIRRMVLGFDVVIEQFRPGVMDRLGIGYDALSAIRPSLVYCSITGYGQTGPFRDRAGHDANYLALAGVMHYSGRQGQGPVPQGMQIADIGGGSLGALTGLLAALYERERTGLGRHVDISMTEGAIGFGIFEGPTFLVGGPDPEPEDGLLNGGSWYDYYRTKDGRYMSVGSLEPQFFTALCRALGHPEWVAEYGPDYRETARAIKDGIRAAFAERTLDEWIAVFAATDACVEPVLTPSEMAEHPQVAARGMIVDVPKPDGSTQRQIGCPIRFVGSEMVRRRVGPPTGADTDAILAEAGFSEIEIDELRRAGVFGDSV